MQYNTNGNNGNRQQIVSSRGIEGLVATASKGEFEIDKTSLLAAILEDGENEQQTLASFYRAGNEMPGIYSQVGVSNIIKSIYNEHETVVSEKVEGVVGLRDINAYTFLFLLKDLPELYRTGLVASHLLNDVINPHGIFMAIMDDVYKNHGKVKAQIRNYFMLKGPTFENEKDAALNAFDEKFKVNIQEIVKLFNDAESTQMYNTLKSFIKKIEGITIPDSEVSFGGPRVYQEQQTAPSTEVIEKEIGELKELVANALKDKEDGFKALEEIIKEKLVAPSVSEDEEQPRTQPTINPNAIATIVKEILMEEFVTFTETMEKMLQAYTPSDNTIENIIEEEREETPKSEVATKESLRLYFDSLKEMITGQADEEGFGDYIKYNVGEALEEKLKEFNLGTPRSSEEEDETEEKEVSPNEGTMTTLEGMVTKATKPLEEKIASMEKTISKLYDLLVEEIEESKGLRAKLKEELDNEGNDNKYPQEPRYQEESHVVSKPL
ncbi:MAG: hypothetical protein IE916_00240 [Epsilonproteobacteria bacterium]|nr:hypothetical protein [Campylobacterota bacterium]